MNMNKKIAIVAAITLTTLLGNTSAAVAADDTTYKSTVESWKASNKAAKDAYKTAVDAYKAGKSSFATAKKAINEKFKQDADASKARTKAAVDAATTTEAKKAAKASGKAELDVLITARNAAIAALTPAPVKPTKPIASQKPVKP